MDNGYFFLFMGDLHFCEAVVGRSVSNRVAEAEAAQRKDLLLLLNLWQVVGLLRLPTLAFY